MGANPGPPPGPPSGPVLRTPAPPLSPSPLLSSLQSPLLGVPWPSFSGGSGQRRGARNWAAGLPWYSLESPRPSQDPSLLSPSPGPASKGALRKAGHFSVVPLITVLPCWAPLSPLGPARCVPARTPDSSLSVGSWCRASGEPSARGPLWAVGPAFQEPASQCLQPDLGPGCARGVLVPTTGHPRTGSVNQEQRPGRPLCSLWGPSSSLGGMGPCPCVWCCLPPLACPHLTSGPASGFSDAKWVFLLSRRSSMAVGTLASRVLPACQCGAVGPGFTLPI